MRAAVPMAVALLVGCAQPLDLRTEGAGLAAPEDEAYPLFGPEQGGLRTCLGMDSPITGMAPASCYGEWVWLACGPSICVVISPTDGFVRFDSATGAPIDEEWIPGPTGVRQVVWARGRFLLLSMVGVVGRRGTATIHELPPEASAAREVWTSSLEGALCCDARLAVSDSRVFVVARAEDGTRVWSGSVGRDLMLDLTPGSTIPWQACDLAPNGGGAALVGLTDSCRGEGPVQLVQLGADGSIASAVRTLGYGSQPQIESHGDGWRVAWISEGELEVVSHGASRVRVPIEPWANYELASTNHGWMTVALSEQYCIGCESVPTGAHDLFATAMLDETTGKVSRGMMRSPYFGGPPEIAALETGRAWLAYSEQHRVFWRDIVFLEDLR